MSLTSNSEQDPIRHALAAGDYQLAQRLWNAYVARLKGELRRGSLTKVELEEARELVAWSRLVVTCRRAHAQDLLGSLHIAEEYASGPQSASPRLIQTRL